MRPAAGAVYVVGFIALMSVLVHRSPWFGFLVFAGYAHSFIFLRGRWRFAGMSAVATLHAYSSMTSSWTCGCR